MKTTTEYYIVRTDGKDERIYTIRRARHAMTTSSQLYKKVENNPILVRIL